ncbi:MAG: class I SAM-dependent methyltransferase [Candidatus Omnitrophica bacterium]|nr:class I SAM-dependent methyltransferase [Candidatus Omnitrophota bacterium]
MQRTARKFLRAVADYDPDYYDMYVDTNETLYARLYVERIQEHLSQAQIQPPASVLEAGCQTGRLMIPFARMGYTVTGVDTSGFALRRAKRHAQQAGVSVALAKGDMLEVLRQHPEWRFDVVICSEVIYLSPQYRSMLAVLAKVLRPGGLLCVSHRPKFYYLLEALRCSDVPQALKVMQTSEGPFRDSRYYNWQDENQLRSLYASLGLRWLASYPIDRLAWLSGLQPAKLSEDQRQQWYELERLTKDEAKMFARYVLVIATRPEEGSAV